MKEKQKNTNWHKTRKMLNDIHLWVGLASGLIIFIVCLTGTIYTYNTEIRELAAPHLHHVKVQTKKKNIDQLLTAIKQKYPGEVTTISIPNDPSRSYAINLRSTNEKSRFGTTYYINPYTGSLLGTSDSKTKTDEFMGYLFSLHRWLLLDKIEKPIFSHLENRKLGSYITGGATILFTIGLLTGMVIWIPRKVKNWKRGLKVKFNKNWKAINHDLHNSLGFYAFIFLFLMGITGPQWSFDWYRTGLRKTLGTYQESPQQDKRSQAGDKTALKNNNIKNEEAKTIQFLPLEDYFASAAAINVDDGDYKLSFPKTAEVPIQISKYKVGFFASSAADQITLNREDATVINIELFKDKPFNERVSESIKALHVGNIYGQFSKLIYFIACLIATSLPVTGTLIWINKMKKTKKDPNMNTVSV